jgi:hypothetical protein
MKIFDEGLLAIRNWRIDGDIEGYMIENRDFDDIFGKERNNIKEIEIKLENKEIDNKLVSDLIDDKSNQNLEEKKRQPSEDRNVKFFEKIAFLKLLSSRKNEIAKDIVDDSYADKLYWIQFTLSCMIVTL